MLDIVARGGPDSVGIDILFAEPDRTSIGALSRELKAKFDVEINIATIPAERIDHDAALAETLRKGRFSLGLMFRFGGDAVSTIQLPTGYIKPVELRRDGHEKTFLPGTYDLVGIVPQLMHAADGLGFVNVLPDGDGVIRRAPLFIRYNDILVPSLGLLTILRSRNNRAVVLESNAAGMASIRIDTTTIPVDKHGNFLLPFRGEAKLYDALSGGNTRRHHSSGSLFRQSHLCRLLRRGVDG